LAVVSIGEMQRLARCFLPVAQARLATILYVWYPAAIFLLHAYPAGLLNCLTLFALRMLAEQRFMPAAIASLFATGLAPLAVALPMSVAVAGISMVRPERGRPAVSNVIRLAYYGFVASLGFLLFCGWQFYTYGDAMAFVRAQDAWGVAPPAIVRLVRCVFMLLVVPDLIQAASALRDSWVMLMAGNLVMSQHQLQGCLNTGGFAVGIVGVLACWRVRPHVLLAHGIFVMLLYAWSLGSVTVGWATLRLIYGTPAPFIGAAVLLGGRPRVAWCFAGLSAVVLWLEEFMMSAGYGVI